MVLRICQHQKSPVQDRVLSGFWKKIKNRPLRALIPFAGSLVATRKPQKSRLFCSCGEYAQISPYLTKYFRFAPHITAREALYIELVLAPYFGT